MMCHYQLRSDIVIALMDGKRPGDDPTHDAKDDLESCSVRSIQPQGSSFEEDEVDSHNDEEDAVAMLDWIAGVGVGHGHQDGGGEVERVLAELGGSNIESAPFLGSLHESHEGANELEQEMPPLTGTLRTGQLATQDSSGLSLDSFLSGQVEAPPHEGDQTKVRKGDATDCEAKPHMPGSAIQTSGECAEASEDFGPVAAQLLIEPLGVSQWDCDLQDVGEGRSEDGEKTEPQARGKAGTDGYVTIAPRPPNADTEPLVAPPVPPLKSMRNQSRKGKKYNKEDGLDIPRWILPKHVTRGNRKLADATRKPRRRRSSGASTVSRDSDSKNEGRDNYNCNLCGARFIGENDQDEHFCLFVRIPRKLLLKEELKESIPKDYELILDLYNDKDKYKNGKKGYPGEHEKNNKQALADREPINKFIKDVSLLKLDVEEMLRRAKKEGVEPIQRTFERTDSDVPSNDPTGRFEDVKMGETYVQRSSDADEPDDVKLGPVSSSEVNQEVGPSQVGL
ncbi:hypothetical protein SEMRO_698_G189260.1 [Seminavis robusta]|uniref:Uncharacterized protein n=1 Tax=Seminavis robusta TaxID=568900 RepID=A0A9N8E5P3_9STRA|nr:hypothetical protein SEMRO_698_G189260.1 [Seminavis robusta]|eukprot:Sro698_g189260.1 n/a (508) ;mRNA; f:34663-36186